jgi:hypothetical protein
MGSKITVFASLVDLGNEKRKTAVASFQAIFMVGEEGTISLDRGRFNHDWIAESQETDNPIVFGSIYESMGNPLFPYKYFSIRDDGVIEQVKDSIVRTMREL